VRTRKYGAIFQGNLCIAHVCMGLFMCVCIMDQHVYIHVHVYVLRLPCIYVYMYMYSKCMDVYVYVFRVYVHVYVLRTYCARMTAHGGDRGSQKKKDYQAKPPEFGVGLVPTEQHRTREVSDWDQTVW